MLSAHPLVQVRFLLMVSMLKVPIVEADIAKILKQPTASCSDTADARSALGASGAG